MDDEAVELVNLTGHAITLSGNRHTYVFPSNGRARIEPRFETRRRVMLLRDGIETGVIVPVLQTVNRRSTSIPEPREGVLYVVSGLVEAHMRRNDVVAPAQVHRKGPDVEYARALLFTES